MRIRIIILMLLFLPVVSFSSDYETLINDLKSDNIETQYKAVLKLRELGDKRAVPHLINAMESRNWRSNFVREIWDTLEKLNDPIAVKPLIKSLKETREPYWLVPILNSLDKNWTKTDEASKLFESIVKDVEREGMVKAGYLEILISINPEQTASYFLAKSDLLEKELPSILKCISDSNNPEAVQILTSIFLKKDCCFTPMAETLYRLDENWYKSDTVISALAEFEKSIHANKYDNDTLNRLLEIKSEEATDLLKIIIKSDCVHKADALKELYRRGESFSFDDLRKFVLKNNGELRADRRQNNIKQLICAVITILNDDRSEQSTQLLLKCLSDKTVPEIAFEAAKTFTERDCEEAAPLICELLKAKGPLDHRTGDLLHILSEIGDDRSIPSIAEFLSSTDINPFSDQYVACDALEALSCFTYDKIKYYIFKSLEESENRDVKAKATEILGRIGRKDAVKYLRKQMQSEDAIVRATTEWALYRLSLLEN